MLRFRQTFVPARRNIREDRQKMVEALPMAHNVLACGDANCLDLTMYS